MEQGPGTPVAGLIRGLRAERGAEKACGFPEAVKGAPVESTHNRGGHRKESVGP